MAITHLGSAWPCARNRSFCFRCLGCAGSGVQEGGTKYCMERMRRGSISYVRFSILAVVMKGAVVVFFDHGTSLKDVVKFRLKLKHFEDLLPPEQHKQMRRNVSELAK